MVSTNRKAERGQYNAKPQSLSTKLFLVFRAWPRFNAQQIFLATKFGNHVTPEGGREIRNDREYIHQAVATSLSRLQTDYIDLLYWQVLSGRLMGLAHLVFGKILTHYCLLFLAIVSAARRLSRRLSLQ